MKEIWKDIAGFEGLYQVSNLGNVKSLHWHGSNKQKNLKLTPMSIKEPYIRVSLKYNGNSKRLLVHRLVAEAFIPNPNNYPVINHKDENPMNNNVDNLEWCDHYYNVNYGTRNQRAVETAKKNKIGWKKVYAYSIDGTYIGLYESASIAKSQLGVSRSAISSIATGKTKKTSNGYYFSYTKLTDYEMSQIPEMVKKKKHEYTDEERKAISKRTKGRKVSEEARKKLSERGKKMVGDKNPMFGKKKQKYVFMDEDYELHIMDMANANRSHPTWILIEAV